MVEPHADFFKNFYEVTHFIQISSEFERAIPLVKGTI